MSGKSVMLMLALCFLIGMTAAAASFYSEANDQEPGRKKFTFIMGVSAGLFVVGLVNSFLLIVEALYL